MLMATLVQHTSKALSSLQEKSHDQEAAGPFRSCLFSGYMHPLKQFIFLNPWFRTEL